MTVSATIVNQYYTGIFRQAPSAAVSTAYQSMSNDAAALNSMLSAANLQVDPVVRLYQTAFNRLPDNAGFTAWVVPFSTNQISLQQIANGFTTSTEFTTLYPPSLSNAQYVGALYWNILQRAGEDAGIKGWTDALNSGALTRAQVLLGFSESTEFKAKVEPAVNNFLTSIANTPVADQGNSALYTGTLWDQNGGAPLNTFTLTTGIDAPGTGAFASGSPAGSSVIYGSWNGASGNTFNAGDQINATGTNNTLNLSDGGSGGTATLNVAATVAGVNKLKINSGETVVANVKSNVAGYTGLTSVEVNSASQAGLGAAAPTTITAAATTDVTVTDTATVAANGATGAGVTVNGGKNVVVNEKGASTTASAVTVGGTAANSPAGAVAVNISGTGNTSAAVNGGTTVAVTTSQTGAVAIGATTAPTGAVTVATTIARSSTNGNTAAGNITVSGGASTAITESAIVGGTVTIANVTGANQVSLSSVSVGATTAVTIDGGTTATVNTTGGNVSIGATKLPSGAVTITNTNSNFAGGNADTIAVGTASGVIAGAVNITTTASTGNIDVGTVNTADKGAGGNVTVVNATTNGTVTFYGSSTTTVYTAGATTVSITGAGTTSVIDKLTTNVLSTVSLVGVGGNATVTSTALSTLNITNSGLTDTNGVQQTRTAATVTSLADGTLTVNLNNTKSGTLLTANNAKVLNIVSAGTADTYLGVTQTLTPATTGKSLTVTNNSSGTFNLTGLNDTNVGTGYTISTAGTGNIALGNLTAGAYAGANSILTGTAPSTITSASTGTLSVTIDGATTTFNGGSSVNTVTVKSGGAGNIVKAINGGTSGNNTVVFGEAYANYTAAPGAGISNFQNVTLASGATGAYSLAAFSGTATVNGVTSAVSFTNAASGQKLAVSNGAQGTSTFAVTAVNATDTVSVTINGVAITGIVVTAATNTTADNIVAAINAAKIPGVSAAIGGTTSTVVVSGATLLGNVAGSTAGTTFTLASGGAAGQTKTMDASTGAIGWGLATATGTNALPVSIGSATATSAAIAAVNEANNASIAVTSVQSKGTGTNVLNILDTTTTAQANGATAITVSGNGKLNLNYNVNTATGTNTLASLDASASTGAVDVSGVVFKAAGATILGGSGKLTAFGSGVLANNNGTGAQTAVDTITTGSGGGAIVLGYGGAGGGTGSTTVNLSASTAKGDTIATVASSNGVRASVSGFSTGLTNSDALRFTTSTLTNTGGQYTFGTALGQTLLATIATAQSTVAYGGSDTYTVSNGVMVFTGNDTFAQKLANAKGVVNAAGADRTTAFVYNGNTYVVSSGATNGAGDDVVITMNGVSATQFGGITGAANALIFDSATYAASTFTGATKSVTVGAAAATTDATGYIVASIDNGNATGAQTINNLAQSAVINDAHTGNYNLTTTQVGAAGTNSLTLNVTGAHTIPVLTVNGAGVLTANAGANAVITSLVDPGNTLATLNLVGTSAASWRVDGITDTALTTINVTNDGTTALGLSAAPISQSGLTLNIGSATLDPGAVTAYLSGANAIVNVLNATDNSTHSITAKGAGSTINAGVGATTIVTGDNATVNFLNTSAATVGVAAVTGNSAANSVTVGANSTVNFGYDTATGASLGGGSTVFVTGNTAGSALANFTTVTHITDNANTALATKIDFATTAQAANVSVGQVNTASATSLADALGMVSYALSVAEAADANNNAWFAGYTRYQGNTYVVGSFDDGTFNTGLVSADIVVKVVGTPSLANFATSGANDSAVAL